MLGKTYIKLLKFTLIAPYLPPFYKKTWQHELPSGMKKQKHSARNRPKVHL